MNSVIVQGFLSPLPVTQGYSGTGITPVAPGAGSRGSESTAGGSTGAGGGQPPLVAGASFIIQDWKRCSDRLNRRIVVHASANGTFNLNMQTCGDERVTIYNAPQVASSTVTVDNAVAGFTQSAELDEKVDYLYRVVLTNTSGGQIDYAYELREYSNRP